MDIDHMPAGREMDALVAERVMGWKWARWYQPFYDGVVRTLVPLGNTLLEQYGEADGSEPLRYQYYWRCPNYSTTDIVAAWGVNRQGWEWSFDESPLGLYIAVRSSEGAEYLAVVTWEETQTYEGAYALGRCRAALKAVHEHKPEAL